MITISFSSIAALPDDQILPQGPASKAFIHRGVRSFREAAYYVNRLPYGFNRTSDDSTIILIDGFGTCLTKHGMIARLALELDVEVYRYEGFYPLTDRIVTGVDAILSEYGLPYIPRTHCFLNYREYFIDLTEGNCTGKSGQIETYLDIFRVEPEATPIEVETVYRDYYAKVCAADPVFSRVGVEKMLEIRDRCAALNTALCQRPRWVNPPGARGY